MLTLEEFEAEMDNNMGYCTNCKEITHDCCEPDARNYECPECGENKVFGLQECLIMGLVQ